MEYDKIILELLVRIKTLEEKVEFLMEEKRTHTKKQVGTAEIKNYILSLKQNAANQGLSEITIKANDIHKCLKLKSRMPAVCNAMKQCMNAGDIVIHETASGFSSTYEIKYLIK